MVLLALLLVLLVYWQLAAVHVVQRGLPNALAPQLVSLVALSAAKQNAGCSFGQDGFSGLRSKLQVST